jgi:hypothetical protein
MPLKEPNQNKENAPGIISQTIQNTPRTTSPSRTNSNPVITQHRTIHRPPPIPILRMEQHMLPIMIDVRPTRGRQSIAIASLEKRFRSPRVRACDGFGRGVVDIVVLVHVAVGGEEEVPGALAVHQVGRFDDAFVRGAFVVEDCCGRAEEGDAVVAEALDAQGGGDYWGDCEVLGQMRSG